MADNDPLLDLDDRSQRALRAWLQRYLRVEERRALRDRPLAERTRQVTRLLPGRFAGGGDDPEALVADFGSEILADHARRKILAAAWSRRHDGTAVRVPRRWVRGSPSATAFAARLGLPESLAGESTDRLLGHERVQALPVLPPLHPYQQNVAEAIAEVLRARPWRERRAVLWMPTGTGKTRVLSDVLVRLAPLEPPRNLILWIANRGELCEQALGSFRRVWRALGMRSQAVQRRPGLGGVLELRRLWGGRSWHAVSELPTVAVATIQTLASYVQGDGGERRLAELGARCAAIVFDEAHHVIAPSWNRVVEGLGLGRRVNLLGHNRRDAPPLIGCTATPARSSDDETERLSRRFNGRLIEPPSPLRSLRGFAAQGYLSDPHFESVDTRYVFDLSPQEIRRWRKDRSLSARTLRQLGAQPDRSARIVADLEPRLNDLKSVLVFACSVEHGQVLSEVLRRCGHAAAYLDGSTPRLHRWRTIERFRNGAIRVLVNCDLLTTGFDAPNIDCIAITRPVESPILYMQMVGRGLRGPRNGGTPDCLIIDYLDRCHAMGDLEAMRRRFRDDFLATLEHDRAA